MRLRENGDSSDDEEMTSVLEDFNVHADDDSRDDGRRAGLRMNAKGNVPEVASRETQQIIFQPTGNRVLP